MYKPHISKSVTDESDNLEKVSEFNTHNQK